MNIEDLVLRIFDPGKGNLDLRAYIAAVIGPKRVAHGQIMRKVLNTTNPTMLTGAAGADRKFSVAYTAVMIPANDVVAHTAIFHRGEPGVSTSIPATLTNNFPAAGNACFSAVLLPGEELYGQAVNENFNVVVSTVWF